MTPPALESDHSNDDLPDDDHKHEADVPLVIDSSRPRYLMVAQGSDQSNFEAPRYSLRPCKHVQYSAAAVSEAVTTSDEPFLKEEFFCPEWSQWLEAVREEFATLEKNGT